MIPHSARLDLALTGSHTVNAAAFVYAPGSSTAIPAAVVGGQVVADRDAQVRRQGSVEVVFDWEGEGLTVDLIRSLPFGGWASLERGVRYADGSIERVALGWFRVDTIAWSELTGVATLSLSDRMAQVRDEPLLAPFQPAGLTPSAAAVELVKQVFGTAIAYTVAPGLPTQVAISDATYTDDRSAALTDLAAACGAWATFDVHGDFVLRPRAPSPPPAPVATIAAGPGGVLEAASETLERSSVRNGVLVRGQGDAETAPFSALATFTDPTSPLRWGGPFGRVAMLVDSQAVATVAAAQATADALLGLRLGLSRTLELEAVPNPTLEPDDPVTIVHADGRQEVPIINRVELDLGASGGMRLVCTANAGDWDDLMPSGRRLVRGGAPWAS
jgi:hypothetical protein